MEIALRSKVRYYLGARDRFGYLSTDHLDQNSCDAPDPEERERTLFDSWLTRYRDHQSKATSEDFIEHYVQKYDALEVPSGTRF